MNPIPNRKDFTGAQGYWQVDWQGNDLCGITILESTVLIRRLKQIRFPHSKKKRIRNKWTARDCNWQFEPYAVQMGPRTVIAHPAIVSRAREEIALKKYEEFK